MDRELLASRLKSPTIYLYRWGLIKIYVNRKSEGNWLRETSRHRYESVKCEAKR